MEKQDPGLRSACYVAQKYLEDYISFARQDLADCLSSYKACNEKKNALVRALMKKHNSPGFDDFDARDAFLAHHTGKITLNNFSDFRELYLHQISSYKESLHKLNLVLYAINNYLSDPDILYVSIHLDNEIVISTKQDLLTLLTYMDLPDHMIQEVEKSKPSLDEAMLGETHCPEKIMFMLSVQQFLDIILDPLIDRWKKAIEKSFNKVVIQSILNENLLFIDNKIEEYHRILADTHDKKQRKSIQNIIEQWELDRLKVHKHYADQLELSTSIQELLQPMELLRECMWHAAYTGTSFSFLSCEYTTADDLVDLADILLSHYMLKIRLPKKTDWVKKFKEYVLSYKI